MSYTNTPTTPDSLLNCIRTYLTTDPYMQEFNRKYKLDIDATMSKYENDMNFWDLANKDTIPHVLSTGDLSDCWISLESPIFWKLRTRIYKVYEYLDSHGYDRDDAADYINRHITIEEPGDKTYPGIDFYGDGLNDWCPNFLPEHITLEGICRMKRHKLDDVYRANKFLRKAIIAIRKNDLGWFKSN